MKKALIIMYFLGMAGLVSESVSGDVLNWNGLKLTEIGSLESLPISIQQQLGVGKSGLEGVAEKGRPFNITDVVDSKKPMRRLLAAGQDGENWLVALEQGGRSYNVQIYFFCSNDQRFHWVVSERPMTLQEILQKIPEQIGC